MEYPTGSVYDLRYNINYYGADYPVDLLVTRLKAGEFIIPNFQRQYVWKHDEASRFIESMLLGLPVPSIFLAKDKFSNKLIVIDGQQRLRTLEFFYEGNLPEGKPFRLKNVVPQFEGRSYADLDMEDRRNLDQTIIHCIIVAENPESNSIFHLFERLNTSGTPLNAQEIRNAIYHGPFNDLLMSLTEKEYWKILYKKRDNRLEDVELVLRFFALHFQLERYDGNMNDFLNHFMLINRNLQEIPPEVFESLFYRTMNMIVEFIGDDAFYHNKSFNRSLFETISVSISRHLEAIRTERLQPFYTALVGSDEFWDMAKSSTTSKRNVLNRHDLGTKILAAEAI